PVRARARAETGSAWRAPRRGPRGRSCRRIARDLRLRMLQLAEVQPESSEVVEADDGDRQEGDDVIADGPARGAHGVHAVDRESLLSQILEHAEEPGRARHGHA